MASQGPPPFNPQGSNPPPPPQWGAPQGFQQQPLPPPAKKSNVLLWVLGGVLALMFLGAGACGLIFYWGAHAVKKAGFDADLMQKNPAYAAAKMAITMAPNVETVSTDDDKGTVTVRNKEDGKVMTFKFDPEKKTMVVLDENGKAATVKLSGEGDKGILEVQSADGSFKLGGGTGDQMPSWVPVYPGSSPAGTFSAENKDGKQGGFTFKTSDAPNKVAAFYQEKLKAAGFTINLTTLGDQGGMVIAEDASKTRTATVTVSAEGGGSSVMIMAVTK